jgi:hypothetical protein
MHHMEGKPEAGNMEERQRVEINGIGMKTHQEHALKIGRYQVSMRQHRPSWSSLNSGRMDNQEGIRMAHINLIELSG